MNKLSMFFLCASFVCATGDLASPAHAGKVDLSSGISEETTTLPKPSSNHIKKEEEAPFDKATHLKWTSKFDKVKPNSGGLSKKGQSDLSAIQTPAGSGSCTL